MVIYTCQFIVITVCLIIQTLSFKYTKKIFIFTYNLRIYNIRTNNLVNITKVVFFLTNLIEQTIFLRITNDQFSKLHECMNYIIYLKS